MAGAGAAPAQRAKQLFGDSHRGLSPFFFSVLAVVLGVVAGLGAYAFRVLIALVHNLAFLGSLSIDYDANLHTPESPWGFAVVLVPVVGAASVVFLVRRFAPEAKGHGVPEVMDAIYYKRSEIRPVVAFIKSVASALSIGTGGSVGREGPIVQIAAAFGSWSGGIASVSRWQRATLVAAGGGAGIAATFNTPIGGVLFAVEVLMHEVSVRTLVPVALATTTATYIGRALFGNHPAFAVPELTSSDNLALLPAYVVLGCVSALAAVVFIRALYGTEDLFDKAFPRRPYLAHMSGMFGEGCIFAGLFWWQGHYYVQGVGYATIVDVLTSEQSIVLLMVLFSLKLVATSATLGSGGSGGIFSPALFMGATLGAAFGGVVQFVVPTNPAVFALAGMAGLLSGATGAVLTSVVMLFEMTLDYSVVLPMVLTASVSYGLRRWLLADSVYTMKLSRRGHIMPEALQANAHLVHHVSDIAISAAAVLPVDASPDRLVFGAETPTHAVIVNENLVVGYISREWALAHAAEFSNSHRLGDVMQDDHVTIGSNATLFDLLGRMQQASASVAVVVSPARDASDFSSRVVGVISKGHLAEALAKGMELFED